MPTPSKFTAGRRSRALEVLRAGGSRREAARRIGVDHATFGRWLKRGETGHPEGRWATFLREVRAAEAGVPELIALRNETAAWERNPALAIRYLERVGELGPPADPVEIVVTFTQPAVITRAEKEAP